MVPLHITSANAETTNAKSSLITNLNRICPDSHSPSVFLILWDVLGPTQFRGKKELFPRCCGLISSFQQKENGADA